MTFGCLSKDETCFLTIDLQNYYFNIRKVLLVLLENYHVGKGCIKKMSASFVQEKRPWDY